jgi:integrase
VVKTFPLFANTAEARQRQRIEADEWAASTKRRLHVGTHVDTSEAERLTLCEALEKYKRQGLNGKPNNVQKDRNRIKQIQADPIALRSVASLRKTDIAAYRDQLIERGWLKNIDAAIKRLSDDPKNHARIEELKSLKGLRRQSNEAEDDGDRRRIIAKIEAIQNREKISQPARTTITNKLQLINRALKFVAQTINGIPDVGGISVSISSTSRERRLSAEEYSKLLDAASQVNAILPLMIRFAIATALRRERILEFCLDYVRDIGNGKRAIVFPRQSQQKNKRVGVVPITQQIQSIIDEAIQILGVNPKKTGGSEALFRINGTTFDHQWRKSVLMAKIEDLHFHDLRHEATSLLFEKGLTTAEVMSITGHSTTDMVDRYSHYSASLVHSKLEKGLDPQAILAEIAFLVMQYKALGGDMSELVKTTALS